MTSEVKIWSGDFMESQSENESLQERIRLLETENQNLRAENLLQNRTIVELRNELLRLRINMNELTDTTALLRERIRSLVQGSPRPQQQDEDRLVTAPPLMAPPPPPPTLPLGRIRISPRQVGAGEAITTPLGISLSSPPRHRVKRDCRQGFFRSTRNPFRRLDVADPGPSSQSPNLFSERPNYFVGLKIIPQFQSFVCSSNETPNYNDSASDSSGSDENSQLPKRNKFKATNGESAFKKPLPFSRNFGLLQDVRDLPHPKVQQSILQNYNLSFPNASSKFFFPLTWTKKNRDNASLPSTSGNDVEYFPSTSNEHELRNGSKVSDCTQYTFPTIHEGLHHSGINSVVTARLRKLKKNIPYIPLAGKRTNSKNEKKEEENPEGRKPAELNTKVDSESLLSIEEVTTSIVSHPEEFPWDCEQDGFQADESSNCLTSADNSLEKISISESNLEKKD